MHKDRVIVGAVIAGLVLIFLLGSVWPTAYRYDHIRLGEMDLPVRIQRFTGRTECFAIHHPPTLTASAKALMNRVDSTWRAGGANPPVSQDSTYFEWTTQCLPPQ